MVFESIIRWLSGKYLNFPPRDTGNILVERGIPVKMRDGVTLYADRYCPRSASACPVVLIRSPYGRSVLFSIMAGLLAERGLQVVLQSARGTWDSEGHFEPMRQEKDDGVDTLNWVHAQPWYAGKLFTFGPSYLGNVQYAMADAAPDHVHAMGLLVTLSNFRNELRANGSFTLGGMLGWAHMMQGMVNYIPGQRQKRPNPNVLEPFMSHLPLGTMDKVAIGKTVPWWQDWIKHEPHDSWWDAFDYSGAIPKMTASATMIGGWQDIFLPFQVRDFEAMQAAGKEAWLTIGPWNHAAFGGMFEGLRQSFLLFSALAKGERPYADRDKVRLFLQGPNQWRDFASWPPPGGKPLRFHLRAGGRLDLAAPQEDEGYVAYVYDPADPTPAVHGAKIMGMAKVRDMAALEARADSVSFTSAALEADTDLIGPVTVDLTICSDREHTDFYACLCDVDSKGRAIQVCDGYLRLFPQEPEADASGARRITINCWPTAYRFKSGHRLRVIVASGAFPRYSRNHGTGELLTTAMEMVPQNQQILLGVSAGSSLCVMQVEEGE